MIVRGNRRTGDSARSVKVYGQYRENAYGGRARRSSDDFFGVPERLLLPYLRRPAHLPIRQTPAPNRQQPVQTAHAEGTFSGSKLQLSTYLRCAERPSHGGNMGSNPIYMRYHPRLRRRCRGFVWPSHLATARRTFCNPPATGLGCPRQPSYRADNPSTHGQYSARSLVHRHGDLPPRGGELRPRLGDRRCQGRVDSERGTGSPGVRPDGHSILSTEGARGSWRLSIGPMRISR